MMYAVQINDETLAKLHRRAVELGIGLGEYVELMLAPTEAELADARRYAPGWTPEAERRLNAEFWMPFTAKTKMKRSVAEVAP